MSVLYRREEFSTYAKDQLLDYIEQQNEQVARFETRFRDVVKAYKGVLKEKEALESSLQALSTRTNTLSRGHSVKPPHDYSSGTSDCEGGGRTGGSHHSATEEEENDDGQQDDTDTSSADQVSTLMLALSTLTQEKSKMELSFQQDKKNLLSQQECLNRQLSSLQEKTGQQIAQLEQELEGVKGRLTEERRGRKEEEEKFGDMLRELQGILSKERTEKETIRQELQTVTSELMSCRLLVANDRTDEYEETIRSLTNDLMRAKGELENVEQKLNEPSPLLTRMQKELKSIKEEHASELGFERGRADEAEMKCQVQAQQEEQRVANLESRLSEMSQVVGEHERQKEQDQRTIQKLKDRMAQLDSENTALTKTQLEMSNKVSNETVLQITGLQEKVSKLRQLLRVATQKIFEKSSLPTNLEELTVAEYSDMVSSEPSRRDYQQELSHLRQEFDTYKQRAHSVLKSKNYKEQDTSRERQEREQRFEEVARMVEGLKKERDEERERHSLELQRLRAEMRGMADKHRHEILQSEVNHKQKLQDLQYHVQTTRERTKKLLEEKDVEISSLRGKVQAQRERFSLTSSVSGHSASFENSLNSFTDNLTPMKFLGPEQTGTAIQELLEQPSPTAGDVKWFLHAQEQQRVNGEMTSLRRKRLELEDSIRDLMEREQRHMEQTSALKEEIRKLERDRSRETENFEYLKNIVLHYMCADSSSKSHLVRPIATVLHFTPNEISVVEQRLSRGWFSPSK